MPDLIGSEQFDAGGRDVDFLRGHRVAGNLAVAATGTEVDAAAQAADVAGHLRHLGAVILVLLAVPTGELLGIGDLHRTDGLALRGVGIAQRVLAAADAQVTGRVDAHILLGHDIGRGQADVALTGGHAYTAPH